MANISLNIIDKVKFDNAGLPIRIDGAYIESGKLRVVYCASKPCGMVLFKFTLTRDCSIVAYSYHVWENKEFIITPRTNAAWDFKLKPGWYDKLRENPITEFRITLESVGII